jgi:hypothetical protein
MAGSAFDFSDYIADCTRDFTGREWVFAEIGRRLATSQMLDTALAGEDILK